MKTNTQLLQDKAAFFLEVLEEIKRSNMLNNNDSIESFIEKLTDIEKSGDLTSLGLEIEIFLEGTIQSVIEYVKTEKDDLKNKTGTDFEFLDLDKRLSVFQDNMNFNGIFAKDKGAMNVFVYNLFMDLKNIQAKALVSGNPIEMKLAIFIMLLNTFIDLDDATKRLSENGLLSDDGPIVNVLLAALKASNKGGHAHAIFISYLNFIAKKGDHFDPKTTIADFKGSFKTTFKYEDIVESEAFIVELENSLKTNGISSKDGLLDFVLVPLMEKYSKSHKSKDIFKSVLIHIANTNGVENPENVVANIIKEFL